MRLCVFCGSSNGVDPVYAAAARLAGRKLVDNGVELVYGGGCVGIMGTIADAVLEAGGTVTGVMPQALVKREIAHRGISRLIVVETMHERKAKMSELADGFLALPGGAGTLEEIFEQWTWAQLGIHGKPCGFLNVAGYFEPLRAMVDRMVEAGFTRREFASALIFAEDLPEILAAFRAYQPPAAKWRSAASPER